MYDEQGVAALQDVRTIIASLGPPLLFRKMNTVLNAIEVQIEDFEYRQEVLILLGKALLETGVFYRLDPPVLSRIESAYSLFLEKLEKAKR